MCGICGELRFEATGDEPTLDFERLIDVMARRGPDDRGAWAGGPCRLGFRRLAILDLSPAANQPMAAAGCALVFNGEVYNFRELRHELEAAGIRFATTGDTEVVLWALIHWGKAALDRFNGMFALGFYDSRRGALLLARDAVGIKPLYALFDRQGLFFASQYDQIMAHPWGGGRPVSPAALGLFLRFGYVPAPYGILEGTEMLAPGSWLEATADGRLSRGRYYEFPVYRQPDLRGAEADEAVNAAITAAVRRQMISDVPLGTFLSGGIDSPLVAAKAAAAAKRPLRAYTIGSDDVSLDETADAIDYGRQLGLDHVAERYTPDKAIDWLDRVIDACAEPVADTSIFPTMLVSSLARRDVTVMLSGDGGDELFWGYPARFAAVLQRAEQFRRPYWLRTGQRVAQRLSSSSGGQAALRWPTIGDWYRAVHARQSDAGLNAIFIDFPAVPDDFRLFRYDGWRPDETAQWLRWNEITGHLTRVLLKVDRASMYHSLEVRVPLLDREVIDVASRVDWRSCLNLDTSEGKRPLRHALAGHVAIPNRPKRGFSVPMAAWLRGPLAPIFREAVLKQSNLVGLPFRRAAMENLLNEHVSGRTDQSRWLWTVLNLALWHSRFLQTRAELARVAV